MDIAGLRRDLVSGRGRGAAVGQQAHHHLELCLGSLRDLLHRVADGICDPSRGQDVDDPVRVAL